MTTKSLNKLIGYRFLSLTHIKDYLIILGAKNPHVFKSESEVFEGGDFVLDGSVNKDSQEDRDCFTLYYLMDNNKHYYITEANFWA